MFKKLSIITLLILVVMTIYGYFTTLFLELLPYLSLIVGITIFVNGLKVKDKPLKKKLYIITASLSFISFIRIMLN
ncbi:MULTISPECIES: hypothetical protein [unclassified Bacillus (in: firmicutes)]|uniref:hypothetical protein n=1 Tax=unclassified Bacillus (in: firmicutes) TaxID=185979 RepID=UPI000BEF8A56|nr:MULTISPECIES: hypothetical protein [unclassified Bacillus (in: firmicutes)]PEJ56536.1 hypothetical protein CN692_16995 [Bacillus sp. AFS002410]PEL14223.1 hypothetical protein CN601_01360 [Bacillus sp. AFS017336]